MMTIDNLRASLSILNSQVPNANDDQRVVLTPGQNGTLTLDQRKISVFQIRSAEQKDQNRTIRQALLDALNEKFEGFANIPDSVKRAMKLDSLASGFSTSADGSGIVVGNKPLSLRRITAILNAADSCLSTAEKRLTSSPRQTLAALCGSTFAPDALASSLNELELGLDKLCERGVITPATMDSTVEAHFAVAVQELTNKELLAAFEKLGSEEFQHFRNNLPMSSQCSLFTLDALITREMGQRAFNSIAPEQENGPSTVKAHGGGMVVADEVVEHADDHDLPARNMLAVANVDTISSQRQIQVEDQFEKEKVASMKLSPDDLKKAGDFLRKAPLTINVDHKYFFSKTGPLSFLGGIWKNLFHSLEEGTNVKGSAYVAKRNEIETAFYPEFGSGNDLKAKERPTYAALNTKGGDIGECDIYGGVSLKLKPEVSKRAVFTVNDSFRSIPVLVTEDKADLFIKSAPLIDGLSSEAKRKLANPNSPEYREMCEVVKSLIGKTDLSPHNADIGVKGFSAEDLLFLNAALVKLCKVSTQPREKNMATFDNLESLLPNMHHADAMKLIYCARNDLNMPKPDYNYIEAQIHGDIRFPDDIEEITISSEVLQQNGFNIDDDAEVAFLRAVASTLNGDQIDSDDLAALTQDQVDQLKSMKQQLNGKTVNVRIIEDTESSDYTRQLLEKHSATEKFVNEHFDLHESLSELAAAETDHTVFMNLLSFAELPFPKTVLAPDSTMPPEMARKIKANLEHANQHREELVGTGSGPFAAIIKQTIADFVGDRTLQAIATFVKDVVPLTDEAKTVIHQAFSGTKMTSLEMKKAIGLPEYPTFPTPAHPEKLPQNLADRRQFLIDMLPTYHQHELPGGFDHQIGLHGRGHICRAFIFSEVMANIMSERGYQINRAALAMGIVGHDSGRDKNGPDSEEMENSSANLTLDLAHHKYGNDVMGAEFEAEFTKSIVGHSSKTLESVLLNSADSLDIGRTKDFKMELFPFLKGDSLSGDPVFDPADDQLRHDLQQEAMLLAALTDPSSAARQPMAELLSDPDKYTEYKELENSVQLAIGIQQAEMNQEKFLQFIEDEIRKHPTIFPLLTHYYLDHQ